MSQASDIARTALQFSDTLFADPSRADMTPYEIQLLDAPFVGIGINTQSQVQIGSQDSLFLALASRYDGERDWDVPLAENSILFATNMNNGEVQLVPAIESKKGAESRGGSDDNDEERPSLDELEGIGVQISWIDIRSRIDIPSQGGRWVFGIIYFDWTSNIVATELLGGDAPPPATPNPVYPKLNAAIRYPIYTRQNSSPETPEYGANFLVRLLKQEQQNLYITCSFRVSVQPFSIIPEPSIVDQGEQGLICATVPITCAVLKLNSIVPLQLNLSIPIYGHPVKIGDSMEGYFTLDLLQDTGLPELEPGPYVIYLIMDGLIFGPQMVTVPEP